MFCVKTVGTQSAKNNPSVRHVKGDQNSLKMKFLCFLEKTVFSLDEGARYKKNKFNILLGRRVPQTYLKLTSAGKIFLPYYGL